MYRIFGDLKSLCTVIVVGNILFQYYEKLIHTDFYYPRCQK